VRVLQILVGKFILAHGGLQGTSIYQFIR